MSVAVPLQEAVEESRYGGKCVSLGNALRSGLPTPGGFALEVDVVNRLAVGDESARAAVTALFNQLAPALAVRSSAVGEDSYEASFAGQHATILNVMDADSMLSAIKEVRNSAFTPQALAYRQKMGIGGEPAIAIALQKQILSEMSGVMFTRNPVSGESERYIEASWGLGEAIVAGLVVPDSFRLSNSGDILQKTAGEKDIMLVADPNGTAVEVEVEEERIEALCLTDGHLAQLHELASRCESVYGADIDIEWAIYQDELFLLQCRGITR